MSWKPLEENTVMKASLVPLYYISRLEAGAVAEALRENGFEMANDWDCNEYVMNIAGKFQQQYKTEIYDIIADVMGWEIDYEH